MALSLIMRFAFMPSAPEQRSPPGSVYMNDYVFGSTTARATVLKAFITIEVYAYESVIGPMTVLLIPGYGI
jgi:hypothetical protein